MTPLRFAIVGAGAVGGWLGARLAHAGHAVSLLARGAHLDAIRANGLRLESRGETFEVRVPAASDPRDLGPQDYVILAFKNTAIAAAAPTLAPLLGPETTIASVMNGIPWWFFARSGSRFEGRRIASVDPDGAIGGAIDPVRIIGGVVNGSFSVPEPGVARNASGGSVDIADLDGTRSPRVLRFADALEAAGIPCPVSTDARQIVWLKLLGNLVFNTTAAITGSTTDGIIDDPNARAICAQAMREAVAVGLAVGVDCDVDIDDRIARTRALGRIKASTLQDVEAGRKLEIDALITAAIEIAAWADVPVPTIRALEALLRLKGRVLGLVD